MCVCVCVCVCALGRGRSPPLRCEMAGRRVEALPPLASPAPAGGSVDGGRQAGGRRGWGGEGTLLRGAGARNMAVEDGEWDLEAAIARERAQWGRCALAWLRALMLIFSLVWCALACLRALKFI